MTGRFILTVLCAALLATAEARGQGVLNWWPSSDDHVLSHETKERTRGRQLGPQRSPAQPEQTSTPSTSNEEYDRPNIRLVTQEDCDRHERRTEAWRDKDNPKTTITSHNEELAAWEEVSKLSADYIRNLNGMNRTAQTLYLVLEGGNAEWEQVRKTGTETLTHSVERTRKAVARAYFARQTIDKCRKWAAAAEQDRSEFPYMLFDLYLRIHDKIEHTEFKDHKEVLFVKASELAAMRKSLEENPIVLPPKLDETTRYLDESIGVMVTALRTDELKVTLAARDVSRPAMLLGMDAYVQFYGSWREEQLRQWQESKIPKYYGAFHLLPPPSIADEAKKLAGPFAAPGTATQEETHNVTTTGTVEVHQ